MQGALNCVKNWCRQKGLSVNADKTIMVLFTSNRKIGGFYYSELRMTEQVKYLGVILDKKLDWKAHLENRMRKACIAYWQCHSSCCGKNLGIITEGGCLAIHFRGEAHSFVCFAGMVDESGVKKCSKQLSHLQCMTCLGITGGMRSTPTSTFEVILMLPPLHLFIKQEARQAANRLC
jgi:hypothetical protein